MCGRRVDNRKALLVSHLYAVVSTPETGCQMSHKRYKSYLPKERYGMYANLFRDMGPFFPRLGPTRLARAEGFYPPFCARPVSLKLYGTAGWGKEGGGAVRRGMCGQCAATQSPAQAR